MIGVQSSRLQFSLRSLNQAVFALALIFLIGGCATSPQPTRKLQFEVGWARDTVHQGYEGVQGSNFMTPLLDGETVYQGNAIDGLIAYDRKTGSERWKVKIKNGLAGGAQIAGERIFFGASDGQFYCVDKANGKIDWTFPARAEVLGPPTVADGNVYFLAANNILYALNAASGKQVWLYARTQPSGLSIRAGSKPLVVDSVLYAGFSDGGLVALRTKDGGLVWERVLTTTGRFRDVDGSPLLFDDLLIVPTFSDGLYAITRKDGQVHWKFDEGSASSAVARDGKVYFSTERGKVVQLDAKTGKQIWSWNSKDGSVAGPALYRNFVLVGQSRGRLVALNSLTGQVEATFATGKGITAPVAVDEKTDEIFVFSSFANLFQLKLHYVRPEAERGSAF